MGIHTYRMQGVSDEYLATQIASPTTAEVSEALPIIYQSVDLSDDASLDDLTAGMNWQGWVYAFPGTPPLAKTILQMISEGLSSDASQIGVGDGWVDVVTCDLTTFGGSSVGVQATAVGSVGVGPGQARVKVDGGAFSDLVIGATYYELGVLTRATVSFHFPRPLADTSPSQTTYTFKLQMQATGVLGTVTPRVGTFMTLVEAK
jgi:hypothetical protein